MTQNAADVVVIGLGPAGGQVLVVLALAVHARVPVRTLRTMIFAYRTFARGVLDALAALA